MKVEMTMETMIRLSVGDWVQRRRPMDGSTRQGTAYGPMLRIQKILPADPVAWCELSDGQFEPETEIERFEIGLN
jgi:hypothetical protein